MTSAMKKQLQFDLLISIYTWDWNLPLDIIKYVNNDTPMSSVLVFCTTLRTTNRAHTKG